VFLGFGRSNELERFEERDEQIDQLLDALNRVGFFYYSYVIFNFYV
jgi:hypothetical protein